MVESESRHILGVDFDNVLANTNKGLKEYVEEVAPNQFSLYNFELPEPNGEFPEDFLKLRTAYLKDPARLTVLSLHTKVGFALKLAERYYDEVLLITARRQTQEYPLRELLEDRHLLSHFSSMMLRPEDKKPIDAKIDNALDAGITDMIDDDANIARRMANLGIRVGLVDRPEWNRWLPESDRVVRFGEFFDYSAKLVRHGSPEQMFAVRNDYRQNNPSDSPLPWRASMLERQLAVLLGMASPLLRGGSKKNSYDDTSRPSPIPSC